MQTSYIYETLTQLILLALILRTEGDLQGDLVRYSQIWATREKEKTSAAVLNMYVEILFLRISTTSYLGQQKRELHFIRKFNNTAAPFTDVIAMGQS